MRYRAYAVTYAGDTQQVNKENYFLNGVYREEMGEPNFFEMNKEFRRRNLYAVSSTAKCDEDMGELTFVAMDILKNFLGMDFNKKNRDYFDYANSAIGSQILEKTEGHFEVETTILNIESDTATVFNMGDMPAFFFEGGNLRKLSGKAPDVVEVEKNTFDRSGKLQTEIVQKNNIPYLGWLEDDYETVPYVSEKIKLTKKSFFVLCSKAVTDVVSEDTIRDILEDKWVKGEYKAARIVDKAVEKNPDENYTVLVVEVSKGIPVTYAEMKTLSLWLVVTMLCGAFYAVSPFIIRAVLNTVDSGRALIEKYVDGDEDESLYGELKWTPKPIEKEEEKEPEKTESEEIVEKPDTSGQQVTKPQGQTAPKPNRPSGQTQKPAPDPAPQQEKPPVESTEPQPEEQVPQTPPPPKVNEEVELPIDFN